MILRLNNKKLFDKLIDDCEWDELVLFKDLIIEELKVRVDETKCPACDNPLLRYDVKFCAFCGEELLFVKTK